MQATINKGNRTLVILILGLLSAIGPFSIDMYLPGFPAIAKDLNVTVDEVSYSLSSFFIGVCIGQMLCGPLLDRFGRKLPLNIGLLIYIAASIGCAFSHSIGMLVMLRFFQAIGGCVSMVAPRAMIRDLFPVNENAKIFSLMILILGVSPIIAPTAGGFLVAHFGWHSVFITLSVITAVIMALVIFFLPESQAPDKSYSLKPGPILQTFLAVLKIPAFTVYALVGALSSAGLFAYLSGSPFVFMKFYGTTEREYGFIFSIIAVGLISCSQFNNLLLKRYSSEQIVKVTLTLQMLLGVSLCIGTVLGIMNLYSTIVLIALFLSCQGFTFPNAAALSMAPFEKDAGSASALMGAIQMGFGALAAAVVGSLHAVNALPMAGGMAVCIVLAFFILILGVRFIGRGSQPVAIG